MIEPFFVAGSQMWPGVPRSAVSPPTFGSPPLTGQVPVDQYGYGAFAVPGVIPALAGPEVAAGPTGRAVIAAVAMRRGQPMGPTNEQEIEEFLYDALDMLLGANDVDVRYEGGRTILSGSVAHKRIKRDVGELAWAVPGVADVQNNVTIAGRRRSRASIREAEPQSTPSRKQA